MCFFFFKQKTAYEMRISDWSSDVCSSDLAVPAVGVVEDVVHAGRGPEDTGDVARGRPTEGVTHVAHYRHGDDRRCLARRVVTHVTLTHGRPDRPGDRDL